MTSKLDRIKRMERDLAELKKQVECEKVVDNGVDCPIEFSKGDILSSMGIPFQNERSELFLPKNRDYYGVIDCRQLSKCRLYPIKREDIKNGDLIYRSNGENPDFSDKNRYTIAMSDNFNKYCYVSNDEDITVCTNNWGYYWIVKAVEDER